MKYFRWVFIIPFGLFETALMLLFFFLALVGKWHNPANKLAWEIIVYAKTLPGIEWYCGGKP